jgi:hypothetical protein
VDIELPRHQVVRLLEDPANFKHWQRGLQSLHPLSGESGKEGARTELEYFIGKRHLVMIETILKKNLPEAYFLSYDAKGVHNIQKNYFEELGANSCRWISESEFQFSGFAMKMMGWFMPGMFKKQSQSYMADFKNFAESGTSVYKPKEG